MKRNIGAGLALTLVVGLVAGLAQGYPLDGFPWTGIVRLEAFRLASAGTGRPSFLTEGEMQPSDWIRLGLVDRSGFSIPAADPALSRQIKELIGSDARSYGVAVLDWTDPAQPRYAAVNTDRPQNPGSVGKIMVLLAWFQALADLHPDDVAARQRLLYETEIVADVSMDQLLAREFGRDTQLASLELSMDASANAGACSSNLSCVYTHTLSWRGPTQPLPMEYNPRAVFERLFGDAGSTERGVREMRLSQQRSILDSVLDKLGQLGREIGAQDQIKVEQYTEAIRDVERRIERAEAQIDIELPNFEQPEGAPADFEDHLDLMLDLQLLALQTDLTRVISFMIGKEQSPRPYPQIGVPDAHHPLSHHNDQPELVERMSRINRYHTELFTRYLGKLRATPDGDGNLLANMTILYGSGISNSTRHSGRNLPLLVMGGGAGSLRGARHLEYGDDPGMANLLVTLMDKLGVPVDSHGASTGALQLDTLPGL